MSTSSAIILLKEVVPSAQAQVRDHWHAVTVIGEVLAELGRLDYDLVRDMFQELEVTRAKAVGK